MNDRNLKEISRIMVGVVALRAVQNGASIYFEQFQPPGKWVKISISHAQRTYSDKTINERFENTLIC